MVELFKNRTQAGQILGQHLSHRANQNLVVLGLPRGGVPVAAEVSRALNAPLDVFVVRKVGAPIHPELALGAIASGGIRVVNEEIVRRLRVEPEVFEAIVGREEIELERREREYRGAQKRTELAGKRVILIDDGLATGASMRAAVEAVRLSKPSEVIVATPVGARETCDTLARSADEVVCVLCPADLGAVGAYYVDFTQTTDDEVRGLLRAADRSIEATRIT